MRSTRWSLPAFAIALALSVLPQVAGAQPIPSVHAAGTVPGLTGAAAAGRAGAAARAFAELHSSFRRDAVTPADQLHTDWGTFLTDNADDGLLATQSVIPNLTVRGGDFLYAPTAKAPDGSCIEVTTAYDSDGPMLWAWDWCGSVSAAKVLDIDSSFLSTYTTTVNGRPAYTMDEVLTNGSTNTWTVYLYNHLTGGWDTFYTSSGSDKSGLNFGWDIFEVYTSQDPASGEGYFCEDSAGSTVESSDVQLYDGSWSAANPQDAPLSGSIPPGSSFYCPSLRFSLVTADSDWVGANG